MTSIATRNAPTQLPDPLQAKWNEIIRNVMAEPEFAVDRARDLPDAARRWVLFAITQQTPLWRSVELDLHGQIKIGGWRDFTARQVLSLNDGYIWTERTHIFGLPVTGFDRLTDGEGEMQHWTIGHLPVVSAAGVDITQSAAGRLAAELIYLPAWAFDEKLTWAELGPDSAMATVRILGHRHVVTLTVWPTGEPRRVSVERWAQVHGRPFGMHSFVADLGSARRFDGVAIPTWVRAGYADAHGRVEPVIEQIVDRARFH